ncbi:dynamin family protein [Gordonia sp. CPCC 205333]|uniref:dynamin family protein n=1 Tax=Gordonia sp. CPCC 205333 TaxID=3140790 RepID=UPI003AF3E6DC
MDSGAAKVLKIVERLTDMAVDSGRADLAQRLAMTKDRIADPRARVVVVGRLSQGKSQLINALLNVPACRVGDGETTELITIVNFGDEPTARIVVAEGDITRQIAIPIDDVHRDFAHAPEAGGAEVMRLEISLPSPLLKQGLVLVDTPGTGGVGSVHAAAALGLLPGANALIICSDVSQEFTAPEMTFIRQANELCPKAFCAATKVDLYPYWREVVAADTAHLTRAGIPLVPKPLSSTLRSHAIALEDKELNEESGYPDLLRFLSGEVLAHAQQDMRSGVRVEIAAAAQHLSLTLSSELTVLSDPAERERIVAELDAARREAKELTSRTALWQQTLGDGISDLSADADYDLRGRFRSILKDFEHEVDETDPSMIWADLTDRLEHRVSEAVGDNFIWIHRKSIDVASAVAESFARDGAVEIPEMALASVGGELEPVDPLVGLEQAPSGFGHKMITGMRGSYGGMMMFGMISTLVGMSMINPFSVLAGVALGRKSYQEDRDMRLQRRRSEAKMAIRRLVDDVQFEAGRESRDRLRLIQRVLRDHFRAIADETTRSLTESIAATEKAAKAKVSERDTRCREVKQQLTFLTEAGNWAREGATE